MLSGTDLAVIAGLALGVALLAHPRFRRRPVWRATVTPLASIIGSGFLVLAPILLDSFGSLAPLVMGLLCVMAALFGNAVGYTFAGPAAGRGEETGDRLINALADLALGFAYLVSVAYYLNLFGAFAARGLGLGGELPARVITTAIYLFLLAVGLGRGFRGLERAESLAVALKLAVIAGLLCGLALYTARALALAGGPQFAAPQVTGLSAVTLVFGLLITVQGFETAKFLTAYPPAVRLGAMRRALSVSAAIYLAYIGMVALAFRPGAVPLSETAVIDLMGTVASLLPPLLLLAALSAQFSAGVADTVGGGGMVVRALRGRVTERQTYAGIVAAGLALTWGFDVFAIISHASRAFALYYAVEAFHAARIARRAKAHPARIALYLGLALLGGLIVLFGRPVE